MLLLGLPFAQAQQKLTANQGHSHNDYSQPVPFVAAYGAGLGSIEADVFLRDGKLYVAHEEREIVAEKTLKKLYLDPLKQKFEANGHRAYPNSAHHLQLVIDLKQPANLLLPVLLKELEGYSAVFDPQNPAAVKLVLSGNMPQPAAFDQVPAMIYFDGRPNVTYSPSQLKRIAMISDNMANYTVWNGKGNPTTADEAKLRQVITAAHQLGKPFRFWATQDSPNTWIVLQRLGVDWINTDFPTRLSEFYANEDKVLYENPTAYPVYSPTGTVNKLGKVKNVILLIGDGMGLAQIHAALMANYGQLNLSQFKNIGFAVTTAADAGNTDSAAGATAIATGTKTKNRYIGVDESGKHLTNIVDSLFTYGIKSAIMSTGDITDATPASFYAHQPERSLNNEIAYDLLKSKVAVLIGSNQKSFFENPKANLTELLQKKGFSIKKSLDEMDSKSTANQLVLVADSVVRAKRDGRGEMLITSLKKSIEFLTHNADGFFIMAEGAQIDHGGHANDLGRVITELHDFDRAVGEALRFADKNKETLVVVTADHETGGLTLLDTDPKKGMVRGHFSTNDHTNIVVPVFAYGPGAEYFNGFYQNNTLFDKIVQRLKEGIRK